MYALSHCGCSQNWCFVQVSVSSVSRWHSESNIEQVASILKITCGIASLKIGVVKHCARICWCFKLPARAWSPDSREASRPIAPCGLAEPPRDNSLSLKTKCTAASDRRSSIRCDQHKSPTVRTLLTTHCADKTHVPQIGISEPPDALIPLGRSHL